MKKNIRFSILLTFGLFQLFFVEKNKAQTAIIFGTISDSTTQSPIEQVAIGVKELNKITTTNADGEYSLEIPSGRRFTLVIARVGFVSVEKKLDILGGGDQRRVDFSLAPNTEQQAVEVKGDRLRDDQMQRGKVENFRYLPSTTGNLESVLPSIALGTNSGSGGELTSQYQVRGGNYDENLVYVNDFEIYRPQLIRAGQQEGLTFPNPDLIRDLSFSSGGFEARYGDKMSSVLDIKYKRPDSVRASVMGSFLGASAHLEGSIKAGKSEYQRFRYLFGARYKTTQYLLGSLDVKGEYTPNFVDFQTYLTYDLNKNWQVGLMGNYNASVFQLVPVSRATATGVVNYQLQITSVFEGQERDRFQNGMGGVSLTYLPDRKKNPYFLKFLASRYQNSETEGIDIIGDYLLGEVDLNLSSRNPGELVSTLGTGTQHNYVRNYLHSAITNIEHKGGYEIQKSTTNTHFLQWSAKYQREEITDRINEWERLDSALYSLPFDTTKLLLRSVLKTSNALQSDRVSGYVQDTYSWRRDSIGELQFSAGLRATYWSLNGEFNVSPRLQLSYKPLNTNKDISYRLAAGVYVQPPFYRELRRLNGTVNESVLSQKSLHIVGGLTYNFKLGGRKIPFKFITEIYYKKLWDLVSYDVDNVRIRYSGNNDATGYIMGWDMRLNGEFVPGTESWINLSLLRARESLDGVQHQTRTFGSLEATPVRDVARPTDQLATISLFLQDYFPKNKNFKMHMNTTVGTGLPYGVPNNNTIYRNPYRLKPYHRVDLGFSVLLFDEAKRARKPQHILRFTRATWASLEFFNLMKVSNEASRTFIKSIYNTQFAIPNYLTSRRINLRLRMDF